MITTRFEWGHDEEYDVDGWRLTSQPDFNVAAEGRVIAHDALEHFPARHRGLTDELLALGAALRIRAEGGWFGNQNHYHNTPAFHMGSEIGNMLRDHFHDTDNRYTIANIGQTRPLDDDMENIIASILDYGRHNNDVDIDDEWMLDEPLRRMAGWMRRGYRAAVRRWHRNHPYDLAGLFDAIAGEFDQRHKRGEAGEQLILTVDASTLQYRLRRKEATFFLSLATSQN